MAAVAEEMREMIAISRESSKGINLKRENIT